MHMMKLLVCAFTDFFFVLFQMRCFLFSAKTTDENLTSENWELILNLCDKVNDEGESGQVFDIAGRIRATKTLLLEPELLWQPC